MEVKGVYIVDRLEHLADCVGISPAFAKAVEFLEKNDLNSLAASRHEIDGDNGSHGLDMEEDLNIVHLYKGYKKK